MPRMLASGTLIIKEDKEMRGQKELGLYIHIPFCIKKCLYCDFLSFSSDERIRQLYIDILLKELRGLSSQLDSAYQVSTVFIGGGTPSILKAEQAESLLQAVKTSFHLAKEAEITMEANPGTVDKAKLEAWRCGGVSRISLGLQSANDQELRLLGRIHTFQEFLQTYEMARREGFWNINVDLISAIPGQTLESWKKTLAAVAGLGPEHISAYSLIVEEKTPFHEMYGEGRGKGFPRLPDEDTERAIYEATEETLLKYGYMKYEISNYARQGFECKHNLGYWERREYLGAGLGAASLIGHMRYHNTEDMGEYLEWAGKKTDIRRELEHLTIEEEMEEFMFLGLRKTEGVSAACFREAFGIDIGRVYGPQLDRLGSMGLTAVSGDRIYLTKRGTDLSNRVFVEFMEPKIQ